MQNHIDPKMMKRRGMIRLVISAMVSLGLLNRPQVHLNHLQGGGVYGSPTYPCIDIEAG